MSAMDGFFTIHWDEATGSLFWELDADGPEFLYQVSMGSGLGSNPIGIDRGQLRGTYVLQAQRIGPRLLLLEPNYRFQARSDSPAETQAVRDAFAPSVHWGFDVAAQTAGRVLVDATDFFLRDARGVIEQISTRGQGSFQLERSRSAIYRPNTASFADNTEVEAMLTFTSRQPGSLVRGVAATGDAITLRQHHSFVQLPDAGFRTRLADPRIGVSGPTVSDFAAPINEDLHLRLAARHRLQKRHPGPDPSVPLEPIVYYVDPGTPEPIRSALVDGASWWADAFEAAGFVDAYRVEVLPPGVDAQDIRYNMIHWTHRRTRGYSYGNSVIDPRTGEIIRGVVNLGSLRLRQDFLMGQGLVAPFPADELSGGDAAPVDAERFAGQDCALSAAPVFEYLTQVVGDTAAYDMALARVRQLAAHEVGHTLGFPHNYMASAYGRESVMDYPAPLVRITDDGDLDLSDAYVQRIGEYDKRSVNWLYREFPVGANERDELDAIAREAVADGLIFLGHPNNTFIGAGHPYASVWDNGSNLVDHLAHEIRVRRIGLDRFTADMIRPNEPYSMLETVLLPLYMHHRFQLRAAVQSLGGADYRYAVRGDDQTPVRIVDGAEQRRALETVLSTLSVDFLALPEPVLSMIPPAAFRYADGEVFAGHTGVLFDPLAVAEAAAAFTVGELLHPQRMARLVAYGSLGDYPTLEEVVDRMTAVTWATSARPHAFHQQVLEVAQRAVVDELMRQGGSASNPATVRAVLFDRLERLAATLDNRGDLSPHERLAAADIRRWQTRREEREPGPALSLPNGDPIGGSPGRPQ